jgi:predicted PurR-regulated permease PerM
MAFLQVVTAGTGRRANMCRREMRRQPSPPAYDPVRLGAMQSMFYRRCFQVATALVLAYALWAVLVPLKSVIGWAMVLAFILYPLHLRLTRRLKGRSALSAGLITVLTPFLVLAPLSVLGVMFAGQVARLISYLRSGPSLTYTDLMNRLDQYPFIAHAVSWLRDYTEVDLAQVQSWISDSAQSLLKSAASVGGNVALGVFGTLIGFFMMLFMLFFFLQDGRTMWVAVTRLIPVEPARRTQLMKYLADVTRAVVFGSAITALVQGIIVGIGFDIVGLPSPVVFGVIATVAAFLPAGAAIVLVPAILYLAVTGRWGAAIFLTCWTAVLWIVENVLRPLLTAHHAEVSTLAIFVGAIGGAAAFGILGLIVGPVLLSFVVALVRFAQEPDAADA